MARIDIAIPCYNYGRFLGGCVESVLSQGVEDLRILIIDNASSDDSVTVARSFARADPRIAVRARPVNLGPQASFNEAVDWAASDYFLILSADDRLAPGALARAIAVLDANPSVSMTHGQAISVMPGGPAIPPAPRGEAGWTIIEGPAFIERFCLRAVNHISGCTAIVRTASQKTAGHYRAHIPHTDDFEMWMRLAMLGRIAETDAVQGVSLIHGANLSAYYHAEQTRDLIAMKDAFDSFFRDEGARLARAEALYAQAIASIGERAYWSALSHAVRGHGATGWALMKLALRLRPMNAALPPVRYLMRMDRPLHRMSAVLAETARGLGKASPRRKTLA